MVLFRKRQSEIWVWLGAFILIPLILATTDIMEDMRDGSDVVLWKPFLEEYSSVFFVFLLIPCILYVDQRIPIATKDWVKRLLIHVPLSMVFSLAHIVGMFSLRKGVYFLMGESFFHEPVGWLLLYEYRKDLLTYIVIMLGIYALREIRRQRLGEAQLAERQDKSDEDRILVSKRGLFHFIEPASIYWVEAAGNYVELHVGSETYMLRSTMKDIDKRLGPKDFVRIHRSTIVNRNEIKRIEPARNGDSFLVLNGNEKFRFSRRYRKNYEVR